MINPKRKIAVISLALIFCLTLSFALNNYAFNDNGMVKILWIPSVEATLKTEYTRIGAVTLTMNESGKLTGYSYNANGESKTFANGTVIRHFDVEVRLARSYAANAAEADAKTRCYYVIYNPANVIVSEGNMTHVGEATATAYYWGIIFRESFTYPNITLTEGTWRFAVTYRILA